VAHRNGYFHCEVEGLIGREIEPLRIRNKWYKDLTSHFIRNAPSKWSLDNLKKEAKKYKNKKSFRLGSPNAYQTAYKNGVLDQITSHMR
jgi:hypothetical protein